MKHKMYSQNWDLKYYHVIQIFANKTCIFPTGISYTAFIYNYYTPLHPHFSKNMFTPKTKRNTVPRIKSPSICNSLYPSIKEIAMILSKFMKVIPLFNPKTLRKFEQNRTQQFVLLWKPDHFISDQTFLFWKDFLHND